MAEKWLYRLIRRTHRWLTPLLRVAIRHARRIMRQAWHWLRPQIRRLLRDMLRFYRHAHHHLAHRPHQHLLNRWRWYGRWHNKQYHGKVHGAIFAAELLVVLTMTVGMYRTVMALSDITDSWNFAITDNFTADDGIELSGTSARLKAQNYSSDGNTAALYHMDESSGTLAHDSSANANDASVSNTSWVAGSLNNALSLNGTTATASAPDSASLSMNQANSLEAWTKFNSSLSATSHDRNQGVIDKGAYQLYYDHETGKLTYELANSAGYDWTQQAGNDTKGSWDLNGKLAVNAEVAIGTDIYVGLGNAVGDAEVWKWDGTTWSRAGGDGINSSWADQTYENVLSMAKNGTTLYAGLGSSTGDGEVWSCDTSTGCTTWTKIGGDAVNSSWPVNTIEEVDSMTFFGGNLYVGLGNSANDARVYKWNGTTWTWIGGTAPPGYTAFPANYEGIYSMSNDGTNLYVGMGTTAGDADVWKLNGTTWTQIGGDGTGWAAGTYETVISMRYFGSTLYVGLGSTAGDGEVWSYTGSSWTQIGGDNLNSSWDNTSYEGVYSFTDDGTNLYAGLGASAGDNEVYKWNGTTWTKIGGDAVNSGFTNTHTVVNALLYANSTLYAGLVATANNAEVWTFNGTAWTRIGGGYINRSWGYFNLQDVESMTTSGNYLYAGTGNTVAGNALVWRFDGTTWTIVGGQGLNSSWSATTYEDVQSMTSIGGNLYIGLGTTANDAEVWRYNGTTWTQIGGDSLNSGWTTNYEEVYSLAAFGGNVYAGLGNSANDAEVWRWNGTAWTKIGGDSLNSGWTTNFERVSAMTVHAGNLYVGLGNSTTDAEVWRWSGAAWSKIGGDGVNSSWNTNYEQVDTLVSYNGKLYSGIGTTTGDAELWEYNGTTWTQMGGDGLNSSWPDAQYEQVKSASVYNGKLYVGLGNGAADGEVWEYSAGSWQKVGGAGTNGSWATAANVETVRALAVYRGKMYAGLGDSANADAAVWAFGSNGFLQSTTVGQNTNWHHVAATYDGTTMKLYIDGTLDASTAVTITLPDTPQPLLLGSTYGPTAPGQASGYFDGLLDEVRISNTARSSFTTSPYSASAQTIRLSSAAHKTGVWHWDAFAANETANGGAITYRLSDNEGVTWKYWNGSGWVLSASTGQANLKAEVSSNIATFPVTPSGLVWQAILDGDGSQRVTLNSVGLDATGDITPPTTGSVTLSALKANGGSSIADNGWTNGSSPYFSWTAATDSQAGIRGYCLYLGQDNTADPVSTKGLLGTSPATTGSQCQFVVSSTNIDMATPGLLGTPLTTSANSYYLTLKAIDGAGNVSSTSVQLRFRFDNTLPSNPSFITAPSGFINTKSVTLSWPTTGGGAPADGTSGLAGLQYRIGASGTWYGDNHSGTGDSSDLLTNDGSYNTQDPPDFNDLQEGVNTVYFRTWDAAGNVTTTYATAALKINTVGSPSEPLNITATPATNTTNSFAFHWDVPATFVGTPSNLVYCYTFNVLPSASNCTFTATGITNISAGPYATQPNANTMYVVAKDESGNINYDSYGTVVFTANTPAPGIPLNVDIVDVSIKATSNWRLALTWDEPTFHGAGVASYKIYRSLNNSTYASIGSSSSTTYIDAGLSQQRYYYKVMACDSTNNCGALSSSVSQIPTGKFTSPALMVAEPTVDNVTTKKASIRWSTDRGSDSKVAMGTTSGHYGNSEFADSDQVSAHQIDLDNLSAGTTYYYVAKWTDEDGNTGTSQEYTFTTAPPPSLKEISTQKVGLSNAVIQFTSKNAERVALYFGKSEGFGGLKSINTSAAESTYSVELAGLDDGTKYFYQLVSYDSEGNAYSGSTFSFVTMPRPRISNLAFQPVAGRPTSTQRVSWRTNVPSTSTVTYGKVGSGGRDTVDSKLAIDHEITIDDLEDDSQYFLLAQSRDESGNLAISDRQVFHTALDTRPPVISSITVESSIRGSGAEARGQVVVSWHTDELSTSQVAFGEGSNIAAFNNRTAEDSAMAFEHIVIVTDLPTSKVYSVQPVSRDRSGNAGTGEAQSAIIGRASDNVLTIVLTTLKNVFGF